MYLEAADAARWGCRARSVHAPTRRLDGDTMLLGHVAAIVYQRLQGSARIAGEGGTIGPMRRRRTKARGSRRVQRPHGM